MNKLVFHLRFRGGPGRRRRIRPGPAGSSRHGRVRGFALDEAARGDPGSVGRRERAYVLGPASKKKPHRSGALISSAGPGQWDRHDQVAGLASTFPARSRALTSNV